MLYGFIKRSFASETFKTEMYNQNTHEEIKCFKLFTWNTRVYILLAMPRVETRGSKNKIKNNLSKEIKTKNVLGRPLCFDGFSIPNDVNIGTNID